MDKQHRKLIAFVIIALACYIIANAIKTLELNQAHAEIKRLRARLARYEPGAVHSPTKERP